MHVLLTNDDGIDAPGLLKLAQALKTEYRITILAPERNWSAGGHVKTLHRPIRVRSTKLADGTPALTSDGAPSDCVAMALLGLIEDPIDLVVSGINPHANLGQDMTYSGTVTAAMEAVIAGVPGIALSLDSANDDGEPPDFTHAAALSVLLIKQLLVHELPNGVVLNINIPNRRREEIRDVAITSLGSRVYRDTLVKRTDPSGRPYYWIGGDPPTGITEVGTDFWALEQGFVSITPLSLDLTARNQLAILEAWDFEI
ncbi:MAG TPA: 5'/3'-nucleotidase SurE [Anaerolineae bacterium]|nr:5'/3'-nucleotidase SurE [Anaerolineae bacterium]